MKLSTGLKKALAVLLASCFLFSSFSYYASAETQLTDEQEKAQLEQRIKETQNKLDELAAQSSSTQEYLDTLNQKISYLQQQLDYVNSEVASDKAQIENLKITQQKNEEDIKASTEEISRLTDEYNKEAAEFADNYELYCKRLRAMYISGETSVLFFLLTSDDISQLLTRYEMVRRVSKQDGELLADIDRDMESLSASKDQIAAENERLAARQTELAATQAELEAALPALEAKQKELDEKKEELSSQTAQANTLLKKLNDQTGMYTEYLEEDKEAMAEIDAAIARAAAQYEPEITTTTTTTTKPATTQSGGQTTTTTTTTTTQSSGSNHISLTYPVPSQTKITCAFGGYSGHMGADFSCPANSKVVAAESGTVIISADLTNADGSYRSYGRYIVIAHDKTTASGDRVYTLYAHNSTRLVSVGDKVTKGQQIAWSGSTGNSTGPHCHFEVRTPTSAYADCKNPALYLP